MLEAIGIFLMYTLIGASLGIVLGFAWFLVTEFYRVVQEYRADRAREAEPTIEDYYNRF